MLRIMNGEFDACLFQCTSEDAEFNVAYIYQKLVECIHYHQSFKSFGKPLPPDRDIALRIAKDCLKSLFDNGFIKYIKEDSTKEEDEDTQEEASSNPIETITWDKPIYTAEEVKKLLDLSDSTFQRRLNNGYIAYSQVQGSDKKYITREDLFAFLQKHYYPSTK